MHPVTAIVRSGVFHSLSSWSFEYTRSSDACLTTHVLRMATSARPLLRMTPAMAPATATGLEVAETFSTSTGARSADIVAGTPSNMFTVDSLDRCGLAARRVNGNQYRIECHGSRGHHKARRD